MLLIGVIVTVGFIGVLMLAIYAKTMTNDNNRLRAEMASVADLLEAIFDPNVTQYQGEAGAKALERDKADVITALRDPDGKTATELVDYAE